MKRKIVGFILLLTLTFLNGGCRTSTDDTTASNSSTPAKPAASPLTGFAKDLQFIKDGGYTYIWVLTRKDAKPFSSEDKDFLHKNAPQVVDTAVTDDRMKAIIGTNFNLEEGNMEALKKRYVMEDYSGK